MVSNGAESEDVQHLEGSEDVVETLAAAVRAQQPVALATVVESRAGAPAQPGFKLLVRPDGSAAGNVGGGALEGRVRRDAVETLQAGTPRTVHYALEEDGANPDATGTLCGGEVTVFIEPYLLKPVLLIAGGGHIGRPLAALAATVGYAVQVIDTRPGRGTNAQLDPAGIAPATSVLIITEDHASDEAALRTVIDTPAGYVGMIGSRRKVGEIVGHLRQSGVAAERLARVHAPIGLDLGGRRPAEIALAILAEVEMVRHGGTHWPRAIAPAERVK